MPGETKNNTNIELNWTRRFNEAFYAALLDAFTYDAFQQALRFELDIRLEEISTNNGLQNIMYDVMEAAENEGWQDDLVRAAYLANPDNLKISKLLDEILAHSAVSKDSFLHPSEADSDRVMGVGKRIARPDKAKSALLEMSDVMVAEPPPWSDAATASFELVNTKGGKAVLKDLLLIVLDHGPSELPKMVEPAAPVVQNLYKVTLTPAETEYDVRKREFGVPAPISFVKEEVEQFVVELRSTEPQWYKFQFLVRWYDSKRPTDLLELRSPEQRVEFKLSIEDLLKS